MDISPLSNPPAKSYRAQTRAPEDLVSDRFSPSFKGKTAIKLLDPRNLVQQTTGGERVPNTGGPLQSTNFSLTPEVIGGTIALQAGIPPFIRARSLSEGEARTDGQQFVQVKTLVGTLLAPISPESHLKNKQTTPPPLKKERTFFWRLMQAPPLAAEQSPKATESDEAFDERIAREKARAKKEAEAEAARVARQEAEEKAYLAAAEARNVKFERFYKSQEDWRNGSGWYQYVPLHPPVVEEMKRESVL